MDDVIKHIKEDIETFIKSGTIGDAWPNRAVLLVNDEVHYSSPFTKDGPSIHAEIKALPSIKELLKANKKIVMYINYSPCSDCAKKIAESLQDNPEVPVRIKFVYLYKPTVTANRDGLKKLMSEPNTTLETIHGDGWMSLIKQILENRGKGYWKTLLNQILEEHWASGREKVLQEILKCHGAAYWKAKSLQTFINHWKDGFDTVITEVFLDDREEKWEKDLNTILLENWTKGREKVLTKILKHHVEDQWPTVLAMILKHQGKDGWKNVLIQLLQDQKEDEWKTELKVLQNLGLDDLHSKITHMVQSQEVDAWGKTTGIVCHPNRECLRVLALEMSKNQRQGYYWLKVVLDALDIKVRKEWLGQRIFTDTSAAGILKKIRNNSL